ncbi:hypothetical protein XENOCAPTIV_000161, partial [Xenoophorus captivus]
MRPLLQFSLLPGMHPAGRIQLCRLFTLLEPLLLRGRHLMGPYPRAPPPHPLPSHPSPGVTPVPGWAWEGGCRAEVTALNAFWRPPVERLRITMMLMGPAEPVPWRTSTLFT